MQPTAAEAKPPYVVFETRSIEDRNASIDAGHFVGRDVDFAIITPPGSKDKIERVAEEWLKNLEQQVAEDRIPLQWLAGYRQLYRDYKDGKATPLDGTSVADWPALSPSQVKTFQSLNIRTVEDVAQMNEESLRRVGMGARALKDRAIAWLTAAGSTGKASEKLAALEQSNRDLTERNQSLEQQVRELQAQVAALQPAKKL